MAMTMNGIVSYADTDMPRSSRYVTDRFGLITLSVRQRLNVT